MARQDITELTPQSVVENYPCVDCLSFSQLQLGMLYLWAYLAGYDLPDELDDLIEDSKCFACPSIGPTEALKIKVAAFADWLSVILEDVDVLEQVKCFPCLKPNQVQGALLYLIVDFLVLEED